MGIGEIFANFLIWLPYIWLFNCSTLNYLIYEENLIFFFISVSHLIFRKKAYSKMFTRQLNIAQSLLMIISKFLLCSFAKLATPICFAFSGIYSQKILPKEIKMFATPLYTPILHLHLHWTGQCTFVVESFL